MSEGEQIVDRITRLEEIVIQLRNENEQLRKDCFGKIETTRGRDKEIVERFQTLIDNNEARHDAVEDRVTQLAEVIEDVFT